MSYSYTRFGALALPELMPGEEMEDTGLGPARDGIVELPAGGWCDAYGDEQAPLERMTVQAPATLQAETVAALDTLYRSWQALVGAKAALHRAWSGDGSEQWRQARLMEIRVMGGGYTHSYLNVVFVFAPVEPAWHGEAQAPELLLSGSPASATLANNGNAHVRDAVITVHAGSAPITALKIANGAGGQVSAIRYEGTIAAGEELVIDCGAWTVRNDGDDAWADLALETGHAIEGWLRLGPGDNPLTVTFSGGGAGSWMRCAYEDAWA